MRKSRAGIVIVLLCGGTLIGCSEQDKTKIRSVTGKAWARTHALADRAGSKLGLTMPGVGGTLVGSGSSQKVKSRLEWDQRLAGTSINVTAQNGQVTLSGTVNSSAQRQRAVELARSTVGVQRVVDQISVSAANLRL